MVACTTGAFGCSPGGLMYAQATASIRDFNMIVAPFPLHGRHLALYSAARPPPPSLALSPLTCKPVAICNITQALHCPLDGRVCSGNHRRLLGNEPVRDGDLRTQNGILRQVTLVVHHQSLPDFVKPQTTLLQHRPVRGEGGLAG